MTKDELGDMSGAPKMEHGGEPQVHKLYQVKSKDSKTAVATCNEKSREGSDII